MNRPHVVILTGAGVSAESGIRTFRASDGLWENHRIEDVATPEGFMRDPQLVQRFYNERRRQLHAFDIAPNAAHIALAELEAQLGENLLLVTQNVDNLHERAGSKNLIHMHGELFKVRCVKSGKVYRWEEDITAKSGCTCCNREQTLRPHIVWFGEMPLEMERIYHHLAKADLFIAIGTSGNVYPAAGFVEMAKKSGARTIELNLEATQGSNLFDESHQGRAAEIVPNYIQQIMNDIA